MRRLQGEMRRVRLQKIAEISQRTPDRWLIFRLMVASKQLIIDWRHASDAQLADVLTAARQSVAAFVDATRARGSLLQSLISGREVREFDHYPPDDLVDLRSGSQFYYHSHRHGSGEHGHIHLFWHATASGRRRYLRKSDPRWERSAPTHLFAISLDARGLPVGLFTVNKWVTDGHWLDAATTAACIGRFKMGDIAGYEDACRWLNGFVELYRPLINSLLKKRDQRLRRRADLEQALVDRRLELLSMAPIDWEADLNALEMEASRRSRGHVHKIANIGNSAL